MTMFYRPGFQRTQLQFRLDNERVPGNYALMLEDPIGPLELDRPWNDPSPLLTEPQIERVFSFDLTQTDAIVVSD
jgi:hypothetical protein